MNYDRLGSINIYKKYQLIIQRVTIFYLIKTTGIKIMLYETHEILVLT